MKPERLHIDIAGATRSELGRARGEALRATLHAAYAKYAGLFRVLGVSLDTEREGADRVLATLDEWRPELRGEFEGIAATSGLELREVVALNARTEILAFARQGAKECSTLTAIIDGRRVGVQTWDWHVELDPFWHTQRVVGPGYRHVGVTEQGIIAKIGLNEAGLALHFNILGHADDGVSGVPMHVLSCVVLAECASVDEALALIRQAPIGSSSAFTMIDADRAVSVEMSPAGVFVIDEVAGSVQRTNHFQHAIPLAEQKNELFEPDSTDRIELIRERLNAGPPTTPEQMVDVLVSGEGQPPLSCVPDMSLGYGDRWATLATVVSDPARRELRVLDGMPTEAAAGSWRTLRP